MAVEKNPFEQSILSDANVIELDMVNMGEMPETRLEFDGADGSVTVEFGVEEGDNPEINYINPNGFYRNLVEDLDIETQDYIADQVIQAYEADLESRQEWEQMFTNGLDLLGLKLEETNEPFEGACTAVHPLLIESAVSFQSKAIQELFPAGGPVKTQVIGKTTPMKEEQAQRVKEYMNSTLLSSFETPQSNTI